MTEATSATVRNLTSLRGLSLSAAMTHLYLPHRTRTGFPSGDSSSLCAHSPG
ncbi:protein of unknown function [Streptomyces sp. KY75]|nr:protein of unknown function [Streptomyces sp. KY75]